jgi:arylformamidase
MRVIDLTHTISSKMPVYPGTEPPDIQKANTLAKDGFAELKISMYTHTGTHMDAPAHMLEDAPTLDSFAASRFIGTALILDFSNPSKKSIEVDDLKQYEEKIRRVDFVLFKTGWSSYWGQEEYFGDYPCLTPPAGEYLAGFSLKGVGIDAISMDAMDTTSFEVHKILLSKDILLIENLTNLESVSKDVFLLSILPLKIQNADGSPVRAVALEDFDLE